MQCSRCDLDDIDLSLTPNLKKLDIQNNKLKKLDCSHLSLLEEVSCSVNQIGSLLLNSCTTWIYCSKNQLKHLSVPSKDLSMLSAYYNPLQELYLNPLIDNEWLQVEIPKMTLDRY